MLEEKSFREHLKYSFISDNDTQMRIFVVEQGENK